MKAFKVESMMLYLRWKVSYQIKCEIGRLEYRRNLHDCRVNIIQVNSNTSVLCLKVPCAFPINIRVLFCSNIRFLFDVFVTSVGRPHKLFKQQWQDLGVFFFQMESYFLVAGHLSPVLQKSLQNVQTVTCNSHLTQCGRRLSTHQRRSLEGKNIRRELLVSSYTRFENKFAVILTNFFSTDNSCSSFHSHSLKFTRLKGCTFGVAVE